MSTAPDDIRLFVPPDLAGTGESDPIRFYRWPIIGSLYRRRVELCLRGLSGGARVLEVGYGSGVSFPELAMRYREVHGIDLTPAPESLVRSFRAAQLEPLLAQGSVLSLPYENEYFDAVLLVSILEHLQPDELAIAFRELWRVLRPGGQLVYGTPVDRPAMTFMFRLLGYDIRDHHFSSHSAIAEGARDVFGPGTITRLTGLGGLAGAVYEAGNFSRR